MLLATHGDIMYDILFILFLVLTFFSWQYVVTARQSNPGYGSGAVGSALMATFGFLGVLIFGCGGLVTLVLSIRQALENSP